MGVSRETLNRRASFWCKHGVLQAKSDGKGGMQYQRATSLSQTAASADTSVPVAMETEEGSSALVSGEDQGKQVGSYSEAIISRNLTLSYSHDAVPWHWLQE